ncbi:MAG TPA: biotin/lipoyl-containing protein [Anaeromyxobacter sp.]|nr:biotin/lipoyl-containing protein [Anaeromyxobacter sp.]
MKLKVTVDGRTYEVDVEASEPETPAPAPPRQFVVAPAPVRVPAGPAAPPPAAAPQGGPVDEAKVARSPVSGIVVRIAAQVGQTLQTGDVLIVLEAMKMETNITAPNAGKIAAIKVNQGDSVQAGQVVVEFE